MRTHVEVGRGKGRQCACDSRTFRGGVPYEVQISAWISRPKWSVCISVPHFSVVVNVPFNSFWSGRIWGAKFPGLWGPRGWDGSERAARCVAEAPG